MNALGGVLGVFIGTIGGSATWLHVHDYLTVYADPEAYIVAFGTTMFCFLGSAVGSMAA